jgi:hypothetical protein
MQIRCSEIVKLDVVLLFREEDEIIVVFLNSPLLFQTNNPNNIPTI